MQYAYHPIPQEDFSIHTKPPIPSFHPPLKNPIQYNQYPPMTCNPYTPYYSLHTFTTTHPPTNYPTTSQPISIPKVPSHPLPQKRSPLPPTTRLVVVVHPPKNASHALIHPRHTFTRSCSRQRLYSFLTSCTLITPPITLETRATHHPTPL